MQVERTLVRTGMQFGCLFIFFFACDLDAAVYIQVYMFQEMTKITILNSINYDFNYLSNYTFIYQIILIFMLGIIDL